MVRFGWSLSFSETGCRVEIPQRCIVLQSRLINICGWCLLVAWFITPWITVIGYKRPYLGTSIVCGLSCMAFFISCVGLVRPDLRTRWFYALLALAVLTFVHALHPIIGVPILT